MYFVKSKDKSGHVQFRVWKGPVYFDAVYSLESPHLSVSHVVSG